MKKTIGLLILVALALFTSAFSLGDWKNSLDNQVKQEAGKSFSQLFGTKVFIQEVGGPLIGKIVLKNVSIPGLATAQSIELHYSPLKFIFKKGDMVPALKSLVIVNGSISVKRDQKGNWNFASFLPKEDNKKSTPPPFSGQLVFKNCRAKYIDEIGWQTKPQLFQASLSELNGSIDLRKKDRIGLKLNGRLPEKIRLEGWLDQKSGKLGGKLLAENISLSKWVNYFLPQTNVSLSEGSANLELKFASPKTKGWPVAVNGKVVLLSANGTFQNNSINQLSGNIFFNDDNIKLEKLTARVNSFPIIINGTIRNFNDPLMQLTIASSGKLLQSPYQGQALISWQHQQVSAEVSFLNLFQGRSYANLQLNLKGREPQLNLNGNLEKINVALLGQNVSGINGQANGNFHLAGPINNLSGQLSTQLTQTHLFGQQLEAFKLTGKIINRKVIIDNLLISSPTASFSASGQLDPDQSFNLQAYAQGVKLSGESPFGKVEALISSFRGELGGRLNQQFLSAPIKSLKARGEITLAQGKIGEQLFDQAHGKIAVGDGSIQVTDTYVRSEDFLLNVAGQTGVGTPTNLKISGPKLNLASLKFLNRFLPTEAQNPTGITSFEVLISGQIPADSKWDSFTPLLDLSLHSQFSLHDGRFADIPINQANMNLSWEHRSFALTNGQLVLPTSKINFNFCQNRTGSLAGSLEGIANLEYLHKLFAPLGKVGGTMGISLVLGGNTTSPFVSSSFWLNKVFFNELFFDSVNGSLFLTPDKLTLLQPLCFQQGKDLYTLNGSCGLSPEGKANLVIKILEADLASVYRLFTGIYGEGSRRLALPTKQEVAKINLVNLSLPHQQPNLPFYSANNKGAYFLQNWEAIRADYEKSLAATPAENLGGKLTATLELTGKLARPEGKLELSIKNGFYHALSFDEFQGIIRLQKQKLKIEKAIFFKEKGTLAVRGDYSFDNNLFLHLVAEDMPLDILQFVFPGREFKGYFNMNAGIDGSLAKPRLTAAVTAKDFQLTGIKFDKGSFSATFRDNNFYLQEFSLLQGSLLSSAYGSLVWGNPGQIKFEANLKGDAPGIINLLTDEIKWRSGDSEVLLKLNGPLVAPHYAGHLSLKQGTIYVKALDSDIRDLTGQATIENNYLVIKGLTGTWIGDRTRGVPNPLGLSGTIGLGKLFSVNNSVDLNLAFSPTRFLVAFPNLYNGIVKLQEMSLTGPFAFNLSEGPLLKGKVEVNNAVITIPSSQQTPTKVAPLNFDLTANLAKNVYAVMGDVSTLNLSNVFLDLEIGSVNLKISGSLAQPVLLGKIALKRGTVNIFNREFLLLTTDAQKKYFPYNQEKVSDNLALFNGEEGESGALPNINLTSSVNVENQETDASGKLVKKKIIILAHLEGVLGAKEKDRGLNIALSSFSEDKSKSPPEYVPTSYSEQDLKVMLLPDFIKSLAGIGRPEEKETVDTNVVVADYVSSRVQSLLFRGVEREVEQKLGLESLTLEYNLGPKVREAMGIKETKGLEEEKPAWSVGFAKGFFDRLYVDVRYAQGMEQQTGAAATTSFNYQLTYKIDPIWSIIYYREPASLSELITGYQKITLKAGFSLW